MFASVDSIAKEPFVPKQLLSALALLSLLLGAAPARAAGESPAPDMKLLERARALLAKAPLIDTHNDLPTMLLEKGGDFAKIDLTKLQPTLCADFPRLREGKVGAQYWSIFVESSLRHSHTALHEALREVDIVHRMVHDFPENTELARTADDLERIHRAGKVASLIGVEGGHMIEGSPAALRTLYALGARYLTLTHWDSLTWADAATDRANLSGLSKWGERLVGELNRLGMFVDLSHVSADTMRDALRVTRAPVIFSHSNAFAIDGHPRNVPDDVLALLPKNGGVVHTVFLAPFVARGEAEYSARATAAKRELRAKAQGEEELKKLLEAWEKANPYPRPGIREVADHIDHLRKVAGIDHIGIGADYFDVKPEIMAAGLEDVTGYPALFAELLRRGYTDDEVLKIAGRNHLRAMRQMERVAAELQKTQAPLLEEAPAK